MGGTKEACWTFASALHLAARWSLPESVNWIQINVQWYYQQHDGVFNMQVGPQFLLIQLTPVWPAWLVASEEQHS